MQNANGKMQNWDKNPVIDTKFISHAVGGGAPTSRSKGE